MVINGIAVNPEASPRGKVKETIRRVPIITSGSGEGAAMPVVELDGLEIAYEVLGDGPPWIITPGGRFHKEFGGIPEMARALADQGQKAITWDRPNCGASSVVFRGRSESEVQAEALGNLLRHLDVGPTVIVGGSGGARVSLLAAARNPEVTAGLGIWWISGGVPGLLSLANYYCMPSAGAAWRGGMGAVAELPQWQEVQEKNPGNRDRFLAIDRQEFLDVMDRWMMAYCACEEGLVPGLDDADVNRLAVPILVFRSGESDMSHTRRTSERVAAGLPTAELVEPPWGDTEWNDRSADYAADGTTGLFVRWPLLVPQLVTWGEKTIRA
jgi:pimeloyl-ACP methyl ester carboxylesterase